MNKGELQDLIEAARDSFNEGHLAQAETILNQLILKNCKEPEVFHMLGTIYYDQGKFNKAIRSFKRALEIDPSFTDASVGLSIILNDLGRYDEGKKVFDDAKLLLSYRNRTNDSFANEKLATKHDELGELYSQYGRYQEALDQYRHSLRLSARQAETTMRIVECHIKLEEFNLAISELKSLIQENPKFIQARIKLGKIYYDAHMIPEAISEWERVIQLDPQNAQARDYLRLANAVDVVSMNGPQPDV